MFVVPALSAVALVAAASAQPTIDASAYGRAATAQFFAGDTDGLWGRFSLKMKEALQSKEAFKAFHAKALADLGTETALVDEVVSPLMTMQVYLRTVRTSRWPQPVELTWSFDDGGQVTGFVVSPKKALAATRFGDYKTKAPLHLPFKGTWTVVWGGRTLEQNYHAMTGDQRFAYDLLVTKNGKSHSGDGKRNDQYFAYGQPLYAPAAGTVVTAVDGVRDNEPGELNPDQAAGNYVVIDHGQGEFSLVAHMRPGSEKVKVGQKVKAGQLLGLCGNSGNSSEAHLHYHLQNGPRFGAAEGLPAQFLGYQADGVRVSRGEPTQGQIIAP
jgi:murein DD-endopeptidase MepM/ murein hydrolase activator NlpD